MSHSSPIIVLVAGEASGDQLGAALIHELKKHYPDAQFHGIGGDRMRDEGMTTWWDYQELAVMGLFEVLKHFPRLYRLRRALRRRILNLQPDVFIGIDAPDFNLGLEIQLKRRDISTVHYVSPTVWAWREKRVKKIARATDLLLCLFPFEPDYFANHNVNAIYVGHPMADRIESNPDPVQARKHLGLNPGATWIALLPGSRHSEASRLAAPMIEAARILHRQRPDLRFVAALANDGVRNVFTTEAARNEPPAIEYVEGKSIEVMAAADIVIVASGTAALETMLVNRPMVVCYSLSKASARLVRWTGLLKTPYASLPNILAGEMRVPELLQEQATGENLARETSRWLEDEEARTELSNQFTVMNAELQCNAGERAAGAVAGLLENKAHDRG